MAYISALFWFVVITLLIAAYLYIFLYLLKFLAFVIRKITRRKRIELPNPTRYHIFFKNHTFLSFLVISLISNTIFLIQSNTKYFNSEGAYPQAKALYFVGNVANTYSKIFSASFGAPDMWYLAPIHQPLTWLKQIMYKQTISYLPEDEPERELLMYDWYYYPYVMRFHEYRGYTDRKNMYRCCNQLFRDMVEDLWQIMDSINTKEFKDKNREIDYILSMPTIGTYYFMHRWEFVPESERKNSSSFYMATNKAMVERNEKMIEWINVDFDIKSRANKRAFSTIAKHLNIYANKQQLELHLIGYGIKILIYKREFSCEHPLVQKYAELRNFYFSENKIFMTMIEKGQENMVIYHIQAVRDSINAEYIRQLLAEYCSINVRGVSKDFHLEFDNGYVINKGFHNNLTSKQDIYKREIEIIENELNITQKRDLTNELYNKVVGGRHIKTMEEMKDELYK